MWSRNYITIVSVSPFTTTGTELKRSLYLPSIGFGFLFVSTYSGSYPELTIMGQDVNIYLLGFILTVISAVIFHEFIESYSGPSTGLLEKIPASTTYQSIGFTLYKTGEPIDYPTEPGVPPWEYEVDIPPHRYFIVAVVMMLFLCLIASFPYTIYKLAEYSVQNSSLLTGAVAFAETVFILRLIFSGIFPNTYRYWELVEEDNESDS